MIKRYCYQDGRMSAVWSEEHKYELWIKVQLAVVRVRAEMNFAPEKVSKRLQEQAKAIDIPKMIARAKEIETKGEHDYAAFVEAFRGFVDNDLQAFIHAGGMTSYDGEEPANSIRICEALDLIFEAMQGLMDAVSDKATQYRDLPQIGRTHGQHGYPITLGFALLGWLDDLQESFSAFQVPYWKIKETKIRGVMGTYTGGLTPEIEKRALEILRLTPARYATQIISRTRHARVMNELGVLAGILENIALNIRILGQSEIREFQEPFRKGQKGSSIMSQKQNTDKSENVTGLMGVVRGYVGMILERIATWCQRSIEQSAPERICFPDAFELVYFTLRRLTYVIGEGRVNQKQIARNLGLMEGTIFAADVKEALIESGMDPNRAYEVSQKLAFEAVEQERSYLALLRESIEVSAEMKDGRLQACFNLPAKLGFIPAIFTRFGL